MKFDVIRIVYEQETVELLDIWPRFADSPLENKRTHNYKFRELGRNEHSAAPSVFPTTARRIQNRTQVSYSRRGD